MCSSPNISPTKGMPSTSHGGAPRKRSAAPAAMDASTCCLMILSFTGTGLTTARRWLFITDGSFRSPGSSRYELRQLVLTALSAVRTVFSLIGFHSGKQSNIARKPLSLACSPGYGQLLRAIGQGSHAGFLLPVGSYVSYGDEACSCVDGF